MKIEFVYSTGSVTLAEDGVARLGPRDLRKSAGKAVQTAEPIGSPSIVQHHRGNRRTTLTFRVRVQYTTLATSALGWLDSGDILERSGYVRITQDSTIRYIPNAEVHTIDDDLQGISNHLTYQITGGAIQSGVPT